MCTRLPLGDDSLMDQEQVLFLWSEPTASDADSAHHTSQDSRVETATDTDNRREG